MDAPADRWGVYVHVPWCHARCPYCAFAVLPTREAVDARPFVERVVHHFLEQRAAFPGPPTTVFFGGGTPSRLPPDAVARLVEAFAPAGEVSLEANPEDVSEAWLAGIVRAGVTRLSLGVQSFDPSTARRLGRARSAAVAEAVVRRVAGAVPTFSLDLMFAVPGEPADRLRRDLARALDLGAPHVSLYGLTIEDGTRFARAAARGALVPVDDDVWRASYDDAVSTLRAAGLERYEVSNFARPGHRSVHNHLYWSDRPYLGLGPSAHSYLPDGQRLVNPPALDAWLAHPTGVATRERPDARARATDLLLSALRSAEGVDLSHLAARTGLRPATPVVDGLLGRSLLRRDGARIALTDTGVPVCDAVVARLVDHLEPATGSARASEG